MDSIPDTTATLILDAYAEWVAAHDTLTDDDRAAIARHLRGLPYQPTLSLLLPLGCGVAGAARDTLAAVQAQLYGRWELCIAGTDPADDAWLATAAAADYRIRRLPPTPFADLADAANAALAEARGDFAALLRPGERLPVHALYEIAVALGAAPETDLLYTDEDVMDAAGQRAAPLFKAAWDPDLLLAQDCIGGLAVWRAEVVRAAGGWRSGFAAAAGHDLALRATAAMLPDRIRHLPAVLLHRPKAAAPALRESLYGAPRQAIRRTLHDLLGERAEIVPAPLWPEGNRIIWRLPDPPPLVSVIVPTRDRADLLANCVRGVLHRTDYPSLEVLIVDNDSTEPATEATLRDLAADPRVRVLRHPGAFNYPAMNNEAAAAAQGEILLLLNNDVEVIDGGWLREMVGHALRPDVGAVGAKLLYADGSLQHAGILFGPGLAATHILRRAARRDPGYNGQVALARTLFAVTGACLAVRREVYLEAGGLNADRFAVAFNDLDFCLRLGELGYRIVWTPFAELFHLESASRGKPTTPEEREQERREVTNLWYSWHHIFATDPYQNSNLACEWSEPLHPCAPRRRRPWQTDP